MPEHRAAYLVAGAIVVDAQVGGRLLAVTLRRARAEAARNGATFDADLADLLAVAEEAERQMAERAVAASVAKLPPAGSGASGSVPGEQVPLLEVGDVARRFGCLPSSVRRAAARGTLVGRHDQRGRWEFTEAAVVRWRRSCGGCSDDRAAA